MISLNEFFSKYKLTKKDTAVNCSLLPCDYCPIHNHKKKNKNSCAKSYKILKKKYKLQLWKGIKNDFK
jgi:hypothetical protein